MGGDLFLGISRWTSRAPQKINDIERETCTAAGEEHSHAISQCAHWNCEVTSIFFPSSKTL